MKQNDVNDDSNFPDTFANKKSEKNKMKMNDVIEVFDQSKIVSTEKGKLYEITGNSNEISDQSKAVADEDPISRDKKVIDTNEVSLQTNIASDKDTISNAMQCKDVKNTPDDNKSEDITNNQNLLPNEDGDYDMNEEQSVVESEVLLKIPFKYY